MPTQIDPTACLIFFAILYAIGVRIWDRVTESQERKIFGKVYAIVSYILCIQGSTSKQAARMKPQQAIKKLLKELPPQVMRVEIEGLYEKRKSGSEVWYLEQVVQYMHELYPEFDLIKIK
ncbi:MAG: hypothetical protein ACEQSA_00985 [Weeksellaceae bacterium]